MIDCRTGITSFGLYSNHNHNFTLDSFPAQPQLRPEPHHTRNSGHFSESLSHCIASGPLCLWPSSGYGSLSSASPSPVLRLWPSPSPLIPVSAGALCLCRALLLCLWPPSGLSAFGPFCFWRLCLRFWFWCALLLSVCAPPPFRPSPLLSAPHRRRPCLRYPTIAWKCFMDMV